jgi:hypothetical protein
MNRAARFWIVVCLCSTAATNVALAVPIVMDFEALRVDSQDPVISHGTSYSEDGFTLSVTCCEPVEGSQETDLRTGGTLTPEFAGSTAMRAGKSNTLITLANDSGVFNLLSIDLAVFPGTVLVNGELVPINTGEPLIVTFEGIKTSGDTITQTFTHTGFLDLTTYAFHGFAHLQSVSWFMSEGIGQHPMPAHQFDNIRAVSVPEPTTLSLLGAGLLAGLISRRRRTAST